jgi:NADH-quinone oxidoreductase subunit G
MSQVTLTIDGKSVTVPAGTNVIEAAKTVGVEVPHYCYHARLSVAGNCRMCLVSVGMPKRGPDGTHVKDKDGNPEIAFMPKLQIGCATPVAEGMVVKSRSPDVEKARSGVMEFLLINHPLDCPICDQAGECRLQEFAVDYGKGNSRFVELKVKKPKQVPLGEKIMLDNERCIMCSRCERFMREVAKHDCLGFTQRGSHVELSCYPGKEPNTNYDLNLVDICPVGALTSKDFRFQMRPWFLKETKSVCSSCSTGCNVTVSSRDRQLFRLTPRDNDDVNQSWMCDEGRLNFRFVNHEQRLTLPLVRASSGKSAASQLAEVDWATGLEAAAALLQELRKEPESIAMVASARATTEELYAFAKLRQHLGVTLVDTIPHGGTADNYLQTADRTPNARGAALTGNAASPMGSRLPEIIQGVADGKIKALIVLGEDLTLAGMSQEQLATLRGLIVLDMLPSATCEEASVVLPIAEWAEKPGTYINKDGRLQRCDAAVPPPGEAQPAALVLANVLQRIGGPVLGQTWADVFRAMAAEYPSLGVSNAAQIGDQGVVVGAAAAAKSERPQAALSAPGAAE